VRVIAPGRVYRRDAVDATHSPVFHQVEVLALDEGLDFSHLRGTVTTFSVVRIPFEGQLLAPPYACAHVVLDGADVPLLHIIGECDVDLVRIGMRVEPVWASPIEPTLASVRYFRPVGEPDVSDDAIRGYL
jgi:hypothetical protein